MSKEIRQKIDELNEQMEQMVIPGFYTLNLETNEILEKVSALQEQCKHHFIKGKCEYCDLEEK